MKLDVPKTMKAAVYRGQGRVVCEEVETPSIASNELLVKVAACGVCPTDIKKIKYDLLSPPRIYGHETAGTIVKLGARVRGFSVGDRVGLHHHVPCLKCHACRHRSFAQCEIYKRTGITAGFEPAGGGFAEYVRVLPFVFPGIVSIPARNSFFEGAMLEPVNTVLKAVRMLELLPGDRCLVVGQGPIGLMFTRLLKVLNVKVAAMDLLPERRELAQTFGATLAVDPCASKAEEEMGKFTGGAGLDAAIIAAPVNAAVHQSQTLLRGGGKLLLFAHTKRGDQLTIDPSSVCVDEKQLLGSYSSDFTLQEEAANLVFSRKLDVRKLITNVFPLEQAAAAIDLAAKPSAESLKVVVTPAETCHV